MGREELDTTERLHFHFSLSCTGEGNGNPLQCSCLENPRDSGAWWAAIYGVAQSQTQLKRQQQQWNIKTIMTISTIIHLKHKEILHYSSFSLKTHFYVNFPSKFPAVSEYLISHSSIFRA